MNTVNKTPLISVCMPVYNAKRYLAEAIESVLDQTFGDFEFLIADDGSTDGSTAILRRFADRDLRIRYWRAPNGGCAVRLNQLLHLACGEFIARMDADAVSLPDRFARQVGFLRANPEVQAVGTAQEHVDGAGYHLFDYVGPEGHDAIQERALAGVCPLSHPSVMMRREAVLAVRGYREISCAQDFDLWLRMGERGRLANLEEVLLKYLVHEDSVSGSRQRTQIALMQSAVREACERRGIPFSEPVILPWRPTDRRGVHRYVLEHGWKAFFRRDRRAAIHFGSCALCASPWCKESWILVGDDH
jgi:glycosyltransferase involved in cell wall biosynthesis